MLLCISYSQLRMETKEKLPFGFSEFEEFPENHSESARTIKDQKLDSGNVLETLLGKLLLDDLLGNTTDCKPFLYKTVEELSEVKSTQFWRNNNVRVLGRLFLEKVDCAIKAKLISPLSTREKSLINLNMDLLQYKYSQGKLIEVFGYFDADLENGSQLKAVNVVPANGINVHSHYKVIKLRNKYVPKYNDENDDVS